MEIYEKILYKSSEISKTLGLGESTGRVYSVLTLSEKPLTQNDIVEKTQNSISLISNSLNNLETMGLLEIRKESGKKIYSINNSQCGYINLFKMNFHNKFKEVINLIKEIPHKNSHIKNFLEKNKKIDKFIDLLDKVMQINDKTKIKKLEKYIQELSKNN